MIEETIVDFINKFNPDRDLRGNSKNWANWMSELTPVTCKFCVKKHGIIVNISVLKNQNEVRAHPNCKCVYVAMRTKERGTATVLGYFGVDVYLAVHQKLPNYYISKENAKEAGWIQWIGNLDTVLPGRIIGGDEYQNKEGKLPQADGRRWFEADINYSSGYRSNHRILYSNDGLIFVSYDHYKTFYEIIG